MNKVLQIRQTEDTVQGIINSFHEEYKLNSQSTANAYTADVTLFLEGHTPLGLATPLNTIGEHINYGAVTKFRAAEIERGLQATSVNRKITAIKEFSKHLAAHGILVSTNFFEHIKPLKGKSDSYEVLSIPEAIMIAEWLKNNEQRKPLMKYYYVILAVDTGIRAEALSKLTPKNFIELEEEVVIKGVDKGKKNFSKTISKALYHEMKDNLKEWTALNQPIFNFSAKNRTDMINRALNGLNWGNRNIVFHSFKKAAVNNAFETTGDIRIAMKVGAHSSVSTTQTYLAEHGDDFLGAFSNGNLKEIKELDYKDYSKEELIAALEGMSQNHQYQAKSFLVKNAHKS